MIKYSVLQQQHIFIFDKLKDNIIKKFERDNIFNQRHSIIVSNGIIIESVPRVSGSLRKKIVLKCKGYIPQCNNNQAMSKFESHVPSIITKKRERDILFYLNHFSQRKFKVYRNDRD